MTHKISEDENTVEIGGLVYEAISTSGFACLTCDLICYPKHQNGLCIFPCAKSERKDKCNVIFKEVKK